MENPKIPKKAALCCIFCGHPLIKTGTLKFTDRSKKKINLCAACNLPRKREDLDLIYEWQKDTSRDFYGKKADWKGIEKHFKLYEEKKDDRKQ